MELIKSNERRRDNPIESTKYFLNCQERIIDDTNTRSWLIVKNILYSSKIMLGLLKNNMQVVIKIGSKHQIDREYQISKQLRLFKHFTRYICTFFCKDDLNKYKITGNKKDDGLCEPDGPDQIHAIIMPYYSLGSFLKYNWNYANFIQFKNLLKDIIKMLVYVNSEVGFLHNDLHLENIMLKYTKKGELTFDLIDFELSSINKNDIKSNIKSNIKLGQNFRKLFVDLFKFEYINETSITNCIAFTNIMRDPFESANINDLYKLIDNLSLK